MGLTKTNFFFPTTDFLKPLCLDAHLSLYAGKVLKATPGVLGSQSKPCSLNTLEVSLSPGVPKFSDLLGVTIRISM